MRWFLFLFLVMVFSSCWLTRAYRVRHMRLTDHRKLPSMPVRAGDTSFNFTEAADLPLYYSIKKRMDSILPSTGTAAFLIVRNDSILYEAYFNGFDRASLLPSNSMSKSFTGTLVSMALEEGKIRSVHDPITEYLPELLKRNPSFRRITVRHLLDMRSGLKFNEGSYDLKDDAIRMGFKRNLEKQLLKIDIDVPPGRFRYQSVNTQLLGLILERATGKRLYRLLEEQVWKPLGMESDATWNIDSRSHKMALASAGINAVARDFARFGRLYLKGGTWNGQQVLSAAWINTVASMDTMEASNNYKSQWWSRSAFRSFNDSLEAETFRRSIRYSSGLRKVGNQFRVPFRTGAYNASGFLNQVIYIHPNKQLIIVRLGQRWRQPEVFFTQFIYNLGEQL
jgi:CubicO group peptidase (beta-lactamase class C family)